MTLIVQSPSPPEELGQSSEELGAHRSRETEPRCCHSTTHQSTARFNRTTDCTVPGGSQAPNFTGVRRSIVISIPFLDDPSTMPSTGIEARRRFHSIATGVIAAGRMNLPPSIHVEEMKRRGTSFFSLAPDFSFPSCFVEYSSEFAWV